MSSHLSDKQAEACSRFLSTIYQGVSAERMPYRQGAPVVIGVRPDSDSVAVACPFCGEVHFHGNKDFEYRSAPCGVQPGYWILPLTIDRREAREITKATATKATQTEGQARG